MGVKVKMLPGLHVRISKFKLLSTLESGGKWVAAPQAQSCNQPSTEGSCPASTALTPWRTLQVRPQQAAVGQL